MANILAQAAIMLNKREVASIVAATGLVFEQLKKDSPDKPLEKVLISQKGGTWGEETVSGVGFPVLRSSNMRGKKVDVSEAAWCSIPDSQADAFALRNGDILVTKSSGSSDLVGKAAIFFDPNDGNTYLFSNFTLRLRPDKAKVNPEYLAWFLRSPQSLMWRYEKQQNAVGLRNLQTKEYLNQIIPVPGLKTQEQVVTYLNLLEMGDEKANSTPLPPALMEQRRVVARIEALAARVAEAQSLRREASEEAKQLIAAKSFEVFSHTKQNFPTKSFGSFSPHVTSGPRYWRDRYSETGSRFYRAQDIGPHGNILQETKAYVNPPDSDQGKTAFLAVGDLMIVITGATVGRVTVFTDDLEPGYVSQHVSICRLPQDKILPRYALWWLLSPDGQSQLLGQRYGQGKPGLNLTNIRSIVIPVPPLEEQRRLVAYLDGLQARVSALRAVQAETQKELDALMPSVLDRAFKGEL